MLQLETASYMIVTVHISDHSHRLSIESRTLNSVW